MQIKINEHLLSIPPYISTSWAQILALHMKETNLMVFLKDNSSIEIPNLPIEMINKIFECHSDYLEKVESQKNNPLLTPRNESLKNLLEDESGFKLGFGTLENGGVVPMMQHNPAQANSPELPPELLQKIAAISKILMPDELLLPKAEPSCNCFHCQIARAISNDPKQEKHSGEEVISDHELQFQQWEIIQTDEKLFSVVNRLDNNEHYNVFLGQPIGCTCGKEGCEHIVAVLKS